MPMRRQSGRAYGSGPKHTKTVRKKQPQSQSSLGSNAAAAHGYTQKGPTRKLKAPAKPRAQAPRQSLKRAYQQDVREESQKGSAAQRAAAIRKLNVQGVKAKQEAARQREVLKARDRAEQHNSVLRDVAKGLEHAAQANPVTSAAVSVTKALGGKKPKSVTRAASGVEEGLRKISEGVAKRGVVVSGGAGGGAAGVLNKRGERKGKLPVAAVTPTQVKSPKILNNAVKDVINAPAAALPGVVQPAEAVVAAAHGNTKPAKKYIKQVTETDPVYNTGKAVVQAATGNTKGAKKSIRKAGKLAEEHPGYTALEVVGGAKAVDRGAGRVVRGTARVTGSKRLAELGSTEGRAPARAPGTNLEVKRPYSRGVVGKKIQKARDTRGAAKAQRLRAEADRVQPHDVEQADRLRQKAAKADPTIASPHQMKQYVDLHEAAGERARRRVTQTRDVAVRKLVRKSGGERKGAALNLVTQGITKATVEDLRAYSNELAREFDGLTDPAKRRANQQTRQMIEKSIKAAGRKGKLRRLDLEKVQAAARAYSEQHDVPLQQRLADLKIIPAEQADRAKLVSGPVRRGEITHTPEGFVDSSGKVVSTAELRRMNEGSTPSYISQGPNARGARNFYVASAREPQAVGRPRTGTAVREGTLDTHPETVRAAAQRQENLAQAAENFRKAIGDAAVRDRPGEVRPETYARAQQRAANMTQQTGVKYQAVPFSPWNITKEHRQGMLESINQDSPKATGHLLDSIRDELNPDNNRRSTSGSFVVVPETVARRMSEHASVLNPGDFGKVAQAFRSSFSRTVLSVSPSPSIGNLIEAGFRMGVSRAGYVSARTMKRVLDQMTPEERAAFQDRVFGAGPVTVRARSRHFDPAQLSEGHLQDVARGWGALKRAPVARQLTGAWNQWNHFITSWVNGKIERGAQYAMVGKAIRDSGLLGDSTLRLSDKAFEQAARGLTNTPEQNQLAKVLVRDFGKYDGFSPNQRRLIANYTPFLAWWMSAARFIGGMPIERPLLTALLAANTRATQDSQALAGLPDYLRGSAEIGSTRWQVSRNTPFGAFANPIGNMGQLILPQIITPIYNSQGLDWKGDPLPDQSQQGRAKTIVQSLLESSVPAYAAPSRAIDYAKNPAKLLNPIRVRGKQPAAVGTSSDAGITPSNSGGSTLPSAPTLPSGDGYRLP